MPVYKQSNSPNWLIEFVIDGRRFRRSSGTPIKRTAEALERKWRQEIVEGKHQIKAPVRMTLGEATDRYYRTVICPKESRAYSKKAEEYTLAIVRKRFGPTTPLDQITSEDIANWKQAMLADGRSKATTNRYLATLRAVLYRAKTEWLALRSMPVFKLLPLNNGRLIFLSMEQERRLLEVCPNHLRTLVICLLDTGLRLSEATDLTWGDICLAEGVSAYLTVHRTKNGLPRSVPLTTRCRDLFFYLKGKDASASAPVFTYRNGGKSQPVRFRQPFGAWKTALARAGLSTDLRIHDLRHTFASRLVEAGVPLFDVSKLLGHKSLSMTMRYSHLSPKSLIAAIQHLNGSDHNQTLATRDAYFVGEEALRTPQVQLLKP